MTEEILPLPLASSERQFRICGRYLYKSADADARLVDLLVDKK